MIEPGTIAVLRSRNAQLQSWIEATAAAEVLAQRHLDRSTPESAYWHLGYQQAMQDLLGLIDFNEPALNTLGNAN
jgi:hypothetical protein